MLNNACNIFFQTANTSVVNRIDLDSSGIYYTPVGHHFTTDLWVCYCAAHGPYKRSQLWAHLYTETIQYIPRNWTCFALCCVLQWRHNEHHAVSNYRQIDWLFNRLFISTLKKASNPALLALCVGNPPVTGGFLSQRASNAETVSIWWRHRNTVVTRYPQEYHNFHGCLHWYLFFTLIYSYFRNDEIKLCNRY